MDRISPDRWPAWRFAELVRTTFRVQIEPGVTVRALRRASAARRSAPMASPNVNGVVWQTIPATMALPMQTLGRRDTGLDRLNGLVDETALFNRALSPSEILDLFNATRGP